MNQIREHWLIEQIIVFFVSQTQTAIPSESVKRIGPTATNQTLCLLFSLYEVEKSKRAALRLLHG